MEKGERKALDDIEKHGLHIINVMEEKDLPPFSYSIGIEKSLGHPEFIVIGLKPQEAQFAINECYRKLNAGEHISHGEVVGGLIEGYDCQICEIPESEFPEYMGWALWLYKGPNFRAIQIIWPSTTGVWPWEPEASEWFRTWQPVLGQISKHEKR